MTFLKGRPDFAMQLNLLGRQLMCAPGPIFVTAAINVKDFAGQRYRVAPFDFID